MQIRLKMTLAIQWLKIAIPCGQCNPLTTVFRSDPSKLLDSILPAPSVMVGSVQYNRRRAGSIATFWILTRSLVSKSMTVLTAWLSFLKRKLEIILKLRLLPDLCWPLGYCVFHLQRRKYSSPRDRQHRTGQPPHYGWCRGWLKWWRFLLVFVHG